MSILDLLAKGARGVGRAARGVGRVAGDAAHFARTDLPWMVGPGAALGGASSALSGGDLNDIGEGAGYGAAAQLAALGLAKVPGLRLAALPMMMAGPGVGGALSVRGDVDAAARKILAFSNGDPARMERAADILYGDSARPEEIVRSSRHQSNIYGIGSADQAGTSISGTERDAALARARQMLMEHGVQLTPSAPGAGHP